jgi:hypothetical protein
MLTEIARKNIFSKIMEDKREMAFDLEEMQALVVKSNNWIGKEPMIQD